MIELTKKQRRIYDYVKKYIDLHNYPPSLREIAEYMKVYVRSIAQQIMAIEKKGYVSHVPNQARSLRIIK